MFSAIWNLFCTLLLLCFIRTMHLCGKSWAGNQAAKRSPVQITTTKTKFHPFIFLIPSPPKEKASDSPIQPLLPCPSLFPNPHNKTPELTHNPKISHPHTTPSRFSTQSLKLFTKFTRPAWFFFCSGWAIDQSWRSGGFWTRSWACHRRTATTRTTRSSATPTSTPTWWSFWRLCCALWYARWGWTPSRGVRCGAGGASATRQRSRLRRALPEPG